MKKLIVVLSLLLGVGLVSKVNAGGRSGQGWNVTVVTGTHKVVWTGKGYLRGISVSSGATTSLGNYTIGFSTNLLPNENIGDRLFIATTAVTTAIVHRTTTTLSSADSGLNNSWSLGDCESCFSEIGSEGDNFKIIGTGLVIRQSAESSGQAGVATVYWSR